jgi:hypothetical protein
MGYQGGALILVNEMVSIIIINNQQLLMTNSKLQTAGSHGVYCSIPTTYVHILPCLPGCLATVLILVPPNVKFARRGTGNSTNSLTMMVDTVVHAAGSCNYLFKNARWM